MSHKFQIVDVNTTVGLHPEHRLDISVERLISDMDKHQIAASLMLSTIGIFHDATTGNQITLESAKTSNRLFPVGTLNPMNYFGTPEEMQAIRGQEFKIFRFYPSEQGWTIGSAAFGEVLRQLAPMNVPVLINAAKPGGPTAVGRAAAGYPAPMILCAVSLDTLSEALAVMRERPNVMVETHELHVPGALELIAQRVGADRIVFGSGAPMRSVASSLYYVLSSELSDDDKALALGGNIKRVLGAG